MESHSSNLDRCKKMAADRRVKAFIIGALILIVIVILQVGNLKQRAPTVALFENCSLRNIDLHRMQIALSKSGLTEYEITDNQIRVPQLKHSEYLSAISEHNAIPPELKACETSSAISNPFLSRSQQLSIEREARKQHIQEMVVRLPFVDTAWFEMDDSAPVSAFKKTEKSAVISIRPIEHQPLLDQHVDTVRQMITGAISGIAPNQIVVIDLSTGFAHRDANRKSPADRKLDAQRIAFARQQMLESRLRESLADFSGLRVAVVVEPVEEPCDQTADQTAALNSETDSASQLELQLASSMAETVKLSKQLPVMAGANGQASIFDPIEAVEPAATANVQVASHSEPVAPAAIEFREQVSVLIDVPYSLLVQRYGEPAKKLAYTTRSTGYDNSADVDHAKQTEQNFAALKSEIERTVRPLLGNSSDRVATPIVFNLVQPSSAPGVPWTNYIRDFAFENWPSLAVLLIGLILISMVSQQGRIISHDEDATTTIDRETDTVTFQSSPIESASSFPLSTHESQQAAKDRLSELIEQDPAAARRVIENWMRDAA